MTDTKPSFSLHHIAISVSNLDDSTAFYGTLGFAEAGGYSPDDGAYEIINMRNGDMLLELFCYTAPKQPREGSKDMWQDSPVIGIKHFGLQVDSIDEAKESLQAQGREIFDEYINQDRSGINYFFIKDPDGILVEIAEDNRGY